MPSPHAPLANDEPDPASADITCWQGGADGFAPAIGQVPLTDQQVLRELEEDFDTASVAHEFARDFAQSWESKYQRLVASVHRSDWSRAKEAVLSVKVTSMMVGASRLAHLAHCLEQLIDGNDMATAALALADVESCGSATRTELLSIYIP
jgi:HPt (histidine-containing phosphotransfer) domain-containing protein